MSDGTFNAQLAVARICAISVACMGGVVLVGWLTDQDTMKSLVPGFATMKANTAVCAVLLAGALYTAVVARRRRDAQAHPDMDADLPTLLMSAPAALVALLTLAEYLWVLDLGIDALIGSVAATDMGQRLPMRMSPVAAIAIVLAACTLLLLALPQARRSALPRILGTVLSMLALTVNYGYLLDVQALYQVGDLSDVALPTALAFLLLGLGIMAVSGDRGWLTEFSQPTPSSVAARNTALAVLVAIPVIASLRMAGQRMGWYETGFGLAIMCVVFSVVVVGLLWVNARRASAADREVARLSRLYSQLSQTNQAIVRCPDDASLFPKVCEVAVEFGQFAFAWIGLLDEATGVTRVVAQSGDADGVLAEPDDPSGTTRTTWPYAPTLLLNKYLFSTDPDVQPAPTPWHASALRAGYHTASIPIRRAGVVVGSLNLYARESEYFGAYAIPTLEEVALDISFALDNHDREEARAAAQTALRASEGRYEELVLRLPVGLFVLNIAADGSHRYSYVSPRYCQMLDVSAEHILRDPDLPLKMVHPEDYAEYRRIMARNRDIDGPVSFDLRFNVAGQVHWMRTLGQRSSGVDNSVVWSGVVVDITEQVRAEHERDRLRGQLVQAQKMDALGQLTAGVAHDFNNILGSVLGFATLALTKEVPDPDSKLAQYLIEVRQGAERARDLVAKMLTFSRADLAEKVAEPLQPRNALDEVLNLLSAVLPASMEVVRESDDDLPMLNIGGVAFHQLVMNLAINARDAMEGHGRLVLSLRRIDVPASICASCQREFKGDYVVLRISDSGPGIAPENRTEVFRPFFTTKEVGKGTGLGLSMVHGIVHDAHGHVQLESGQGRGASFLLYFPVRYDVPATNAAPAHAEHAVSGNGAHIAIVDDEPVLTLLWREWLERYDYRVTSFNDSAAALAAFRNSPGAFDAVVVDMTMPQLSGDNLAKQMLSLRPLLPVFICTGYTDRLDTLLAHTLGIRGVFPKPVDFDLALKTLTDVLEEMRAPRAD